MLLTPNNEFFKFVILHYRRTISLTFIELIFGTCFLQVRKLMARSQLHALLGQVTLKPKDGVLWAYPTLKAKGLTEVSPLPLILVAGAGFEPATFGL
jgi:hypothetical protein